MTSVTDSSRSPKSGSNIEGRKTKRLTMVEKARLEALASFGYQGFDTLSVKKDDFHTKLQASTTKSDNTTRRAMTRLERAKLEANSAFKDVHLGQKTVNSKKRKLQETGTDSENSAPKKSTLTRLQKAKQEANKAFENVSLATIPKKRSKLEQEQLLCKKNKNVEQKVDWDSPRQNRVGEIKSSNESTKRITRSQSTKIKPIVNTKLRGVKNKRHLPLMTTAKSTLSMSKTTQNPTTTTPDTTTTTPNTTTTTSSITETPPNHTSEIEATDDAHTLQEINENKEETTSENTKEEPKLLTRIERAKLEAIESFKGQHLDEVCKESKKIVAKYLKPKKTNSQDTQAAVRTPLVLSHRNKHGKQTNFDVYSCIHGDENFNDHTVLMETSRRVVKTAVSLETPEGSPACH